MQQKLPDKHNLRNVWRKDSSGEYKLIGINWTDTELPNGFDWHLRHSKGTLPGDSSACGCFDGDTLVGYATKHHAEYLVPSLISIFCSSKIVMLRSAFQ